MEDSNLEEKARQALLLKRKELRWKLMEASQIQNRAKLDEIKAEANYTKKKMMKIAKLASKLRAKFLKVAEASKMAESAYSEIEAELLKQEKFVADEKMQLTKLAVDCRNIGSQLYGSNYVLNSNFNDTKTKDKRRAAIRIKDAKYALSNQMIELEKKANIHSAAKKLLTLARAQALSRKDITPNQPAPTRLSSLYDLKNSILQNLASYRLTTKFMETGIPLTDLNYTHNICPNCFVCLPDLIGTCTDKKCLYQHKSNYLMTDIDKLTDILSYKPSLTGFKVDSVKNREENDNLCRLKLKQYAAKLLVKNVDKTVDTTAQTLVKYVRASKSDQELLVMVRQLPKVRHLVCNIPEEEKIAEEEKPDEDNNDIPAEEVSMEDSDDSVSIDDDVQVKISC